MYTQFANLTQPYTWLLFLTTAVTWGMTAIVWHYKNKPGATPLSVMLLAMGLWSLGSALEFMTVSLEAKDFWVKWAWVGIAFVPTFLLAAAFCLTGQGKILQSTWFLLWWLLPLTTIALVFTNARHHLMWRGLYWISQPDNIFAYEFGPWFWLHIIFANIAVMTAVILFVRSYRQQQGVFKWQAAGILPALLLPWIANILYLLKLGPAVDLTPIAFGLTGLLLALSFLRFQLLNLTPVARNRLIEEMREGMLVLDAGNRIVDLNPVLAGWAGVEIRRVIGQHVGAAFAHWTELIDWLGTSNSDLHELQIPDLGYLEFRTSSLYTRSGTLSGRLILVQDITARKKAELALQTAHDSLEQRVIEQTADLRATNERLRQEMAQKAQAEAAVRALNQTLEKRVLARTRELSTLYEVSAAANRPLELPALLQEMLSQMVHAMPSAQGAVFLVNDSGSLTSELPAATWNDDGSPDWEAMGRWLLANGFLARLSREQDTILLPTEFSPVFDGSVLLLPLAFSGQLQGVLLLTLPADRHFDREEVALYMAIADQMTAVIENDHLRQRALQASVLEERDRLARDLHDAVTQSLYGLVTLSEAAQLTLENEQIDRLPHLLNRIGATTRQSIKEMRLYIHQLRPPILETEGLVAALHQRLAAVEGRSNVNARLVADPEIGLTTVQQAELYQIAREALNNALRHADASTVTLNLTQDKTGTQLKIVDDGRGFEPDLPDRSGMGLINMKQRTKAMGGTLQIVSNPGQGAVITVTLPTVTLRQNQ